MKSDPSREQSPMSHMRAPFKNPFPGPQPYRAADRARFFGRDTLVKKLSNQILAHPLTTLYGPSGAGKSSLMQAGVIPRLEETHDFRVVRVDGWPPLERPLPWLVRALFNDLELGAPPDEMQPLEVLGEAMSLAERRSEQPILIYLDQIEQLLFPGRTDAEAEALIDGVDRLARAPIPGLQIVLSLREDYLGRFRDRAKDKRELLAHGFRLGPLTVMEMVNAVCKAAQQGTPSQIWDPLQMQDLLMDVRVPGQSPQPEAEVQAAYAQIVCRALFKERGAHPIKAEGESTETFRVRVTLIPHGLGDDGDSTEIHVVSGSDSALQCEGEAEYILRRYLDKTLGELEDLSLDARRLLEDQLVSADGSRTLRTEKELLRILPVEKLAPILSALENAAILHAEEHQGSRYFEIGHDWLARKVYEERQKREQDEEQRLRDEEQAKKLARQKEEADAKYAQVRAQRRFLGIVAAISLGVALGAAALGLWAVAQQRKAENAGRRAENALQKAKAAEQAAEQRAIEAMDARLVTSSNELFSSAHYAWGSKLLSQVQQPSKARGWLDLANATLAGNALEATLGGHAQVPRAAVWSHDAKYVLSVSGEKVARRWNSDGRGEPVLFEGHEASINDIAISPDDKHILTASDDGTLKIWKADAQGGPLSLEGHGGAAIKAAWSPDGQKVLGAFMDRIIRVWNADGSGLVELRGHTGALNSAVFVGNDRVLSASADRTARLWSADGNKRLTLIFRGHKDAVLFAEPSPDLSQIVTASADKSARVWASTGKGNPLVLEGHDSSVVHAAFSPDGRHLATASEDKCAKIWSIAPGTEKQPPVELGMVFIPGGDRASNTHLRGVNFVAFRPDGRYLATAGGDKMVSIWPVEGGLALVLREHDAPVRSLAWSPDGRRLLTVAGEDTESRSVDYSVRLWRPGNLERLRRVQAAFFHSAFIAQGPLEPSLVLSAYDDRSLRLWPVDGWGDIKLFSAREKEPWVAYASLSPDRKSIALASFDKSVHILDAERGVERAVLKGHTAPIRSALFSPDGQRIASASDDGTARIFQADGSGESLVFKGHGDSLSWAEFSPDQKRIVTASLDHSARIWNADGQGEPTVLSGHGGAVLWAGFSSDSKRILTASEDHTAQIWDAENGRPLLSLPHKSPVLCAAWAPGAKSLATCSDEDGLRLWDAEGQREPVELGLSGCLLSMAFSEDGRELIGVTRNNTTRTWVVDEIKLVALLKASNNDCLPVDKRRSYLGESQFGAEREYAACEQGHGRSIKPAKGNKP